MAELLALVDKNLKDNCADNISVGCFKFNETASEFSFRFVIRFVVCFSMYSSQNISHCS